VGQYRVRTVMIMQYGYSFVHEFHQIISNKDESIWDVLDDLNEAHLVCQQMNFHSEYDNREEYFLPSKKKDIVKVFKAKPKMVKIDIPNVKLVNRVPLPLIDYPGPSEVKEKRVWTEEDKRWFKMVGIKEEYYS